MQSNSDLIKVIQSLNIDSPRVFEALSLSNLIFYFQNITTPTSLQPYIPMSKHQEIIDALGLRLPDDIQVHFNIPINGKIGNQTLSDTEQITFKYDRISDYWEFLPTKRIPQYILMLDGHEKYFISPSMSVEDICENIKTEKIPYEWYHFGTEYEMRDPQDKHNIWNYSEFFSIACYLVTNSIGASPIQCTQLITYSDLPDQIQRVTRNEVTLHPDNPFHSALSYIKYVRANSNSKGTKTRALCMSLVPLYQVNQDIILNILKYDMK